MTETRLFAELLKSGTDNLKATNFECYKQIAGDLYISVIHLS